MRLTFLGTGTSFGVPVLGCGCAVCTSEDPRDRRFRHAALLSWSDGTSLLVDTPPELRLQLLAARVTRIDGVWFTHVHADHLHGIDDLRAFSMRTRRSIPAYASAEARAVIERRFDYIFDPKVRPGAGSSKPHIDFHTVAAGETLSVEGRAITPLDAPHGPLRVMGFRVGELGYITDAKRLPPEAMALLAGVRVLVLNALWWGDPHPTHFNVEEALETAERIGAECTYLTHLTHRTSHEALMASLPAGVAAAYDGLSIEVDEGNDSPPHTRGAPPTEDDS